MSPGDLTPGRGDITRSALPTQDEIMRLDCCYQQMILNYDPQHSASGPLLDDVKTQEIFSQANILLMIGVGQLLPGR